MTRSEENYLKSIFHLAEDNTSVSTNALAKKMKIKASSATDMIKKLSEKGHVYYKKYKGVKLTKKGRLAATSIIRKHRLWEVFLVDKLGFSWDEVHEVAEQLEHIKSSKLTDELDSFLNYPKADPHGDPIPDSDGNIIDSKKQVLANVSIHANCICIGVNDSSKFFLKYLDKFKIKLGTKITVLSREFYDSSMTVLINNKKTSISKEVSNNLYVEII